jgi:hypothetical protein
MNLNIEASIASARRSGAMLFLVVSWRMQEGGEKASQVKPEAAFAESILSGILLEFRWGILVRLEPGLGPRGEASTGCVRVKHHHHRRRHRRCPCAPGSNPGKIPDDLHEAQRVLL